MSFGILIFIVAILVVVMIHESGHFLVAKLFGFKAPQFFVGFGPTLWSFKRGETEYGVKAIPAGGFVKIVGMNPYEEVPPQDQPRSYPNKPRWQRALLLVAGSATHWVIAFVVLFVTALTLGFPTDQLSTNVAVVETQTPAGQAGFEPGDRIAGAEGVAFDSWPEIRRFIQNHPGEQVDFRVERDEEMVEVTATIGKAIFSKNGELVVSEQDGELRSPRSGEEVLGFLGVSPELVYESYSVTGAVAEAGQLTWTVTVDSVKAIPKVFVPVFNGELWGALSGEEERTVDGPIGVVGAGRIAGESVQTGNYLRLIGLIVGFTIIVGILNLLPLPPLDGGHLAVVAYEAITGRTVDIRKLIPVAAAVISFFVLLFLAVLYLDIARPLETPF